MRRMRTIRTYTELIKLPTFEERFNYLKLGDKVGKETFAFERYLNQNFYHNSREWKRIRRDVIVRDMGCDMGLEGYEIHGSIYVHHMNPVRRSDIIHGTDLLLNPEYLICVKFATHNAIHYGDDTILRTNVITERTPNDTCPWKS